jgi:hypothetical protein
VGKARSQETGTKKTEEEHHEGKAEKAGTQEAGSLDPDYRARE